MRQIIKNIAVFLIGIIILITALLVTLGRGVSAQRLWLGPVMVSGLYIKIENRLILRADEVQIRDIKSLFAASDSAKTGEPPTIKRDDGLDESQIKDALWVARHLKWLRVFEEISIGRLIIDEYEGQFGYSQNRFFVDTSQLRLGVEIKERDGGLAASVNELILKRFNTSILGGVWADIKRSSYQFSGSFRAHELAGYVKLSLNGAVLDFELNDIKGDGLQNFMDAISKETGLNEQIGVWIYGNIIAQHYSVSRVSGKMNLKTGELNAKNLRIDAELSGAKIKFHPQLDPVLADKIGIKMADDRLDFTLINPTFKNRSLNGSKVAINSVMSKGANIVIDIYTNALFDDDIAGIIAAYGGDIAVRQLGGGLKSHFNLAMEFAKLQPVMQGEFIIDNGVVEIGGKGGRAGSRFAVKSAAVRLETDGRVMINNASAKNDIFTADFSGYISPKDKSAAFDAAFKSINIDGLLSAADIKSPVSLKWDDNSTMAEVGALGVGLKFASINEINIADLGELAKYSKIAKNFNLKGGALAIKTADFKDFDAEIEGARFSVGLFKKDGGEWAEDDFKITSRATIIKVGSRSGILSLNIKDNNINADIRGVRYILAESEAGKGAATQNTPPLNNDSWPLDTGDKTVHINAADFGILSGERRLLFKEAQATLKGKIANFSGQLFYGGSVTGRAGPGAIKIDGERIMPQSVNELLKGEVFDGGEFSVHITGSDKAAFGGEVRASNTHLGEFKGSQQFLAFLDTVPSLLSLKLPDFNNRGISIDSGVMRFEKRAQNLYIPAFELLGSSVDIVGSAVVADSGVVDGQMELRVLKRAGSIIGKLPVVRDIILGDDGSISTLIKISGTTDKVDYKTQIATDIATMPYNIIKNTLSLPFKWLK